MTQILSQSRENDEGEENNEYGISADEYESTLDVADVEANMLRPVPTSFSTYSQLDRRPTTRKEILGWLSFALAAEPYVVAAVGIYLPIILEQLARDNSVSAKDHSMPCNWEISEPVDPPYGPTPPETDHRCVIYAFGAYIDPASYALYTFSISVFFQAIVVISMSGAADRGNFRKKLLITFSVIGALSSIFMIFAVSKLYYLASFFSIVGNVSFGVVAVCGNAFLPVLVRNHPDVLEADKHYLSTDFPEETYSHITASSADRTISVESVESIQSAKPALASHNGHASFESFPDDAIASESRHLFEDELNFKQPIKAIEISNHLSGLGVACGYLSAFIVQASGIAFIAFMGSSMFSIRLVLIGIGIWWLVFTIPAALYMRPRPGPQLHIAHGENIIFKYVTYAWKTLWKTAQEVRNLKDVVLYLAGWFILSDSVTTINATSILFARTELKMEPAALAVVGIITMISGITGAIVFSRYVESYLKIPPNQIIILIVGIAAVIPTYGILGFVTDKFGLHHAWEIYILASIYGLALGGMASICRSTFSMLIPPGKESTFFSLYAVTDKGSSIVGPTITAMITDKTHNIRYTFFFLFFLLLSAIPIFYFLDVERGKRDAIRFGEQRAEEEEEEEEEEANQIQAL
ncbi:autophagy-related protein 22-like protein [Lipomyces japonicus]|uniref:autophagy-related protein 22-like protein n=1 Tax=Lipomyces japonicus TaxID=56871 RepID=UPI0034CEF29D